MGNNKHNQLAGKNRTIYQITQCDKNILLFVSCFSLTFNNISTHNSIKGFCRTKNSKLRHPSSFHYFLELICSCTSVQADVEPGMFSFFFKLLRFVTLQHKFCIRYRGQTRETRCIESSYSSCFQMDILYRVYVGLINSFCFWFSFFSA